MSRTPRLIVAEDDDRVVEMPECPNCGKRALVAQTKDKYACIHCNFRRDLSAPSVGRGAGEFLAGGITGIGLLLLL